MPSQTFLNLSKEKQQNLLNAAIKEFSRTNFNDASINKIIIDANISRGSFYIYFKDKQDIYNYIFQNYFEKLKFKIKQLLKENNGDFIEVADRLYKIIIEFCEDKNHICLFKNFFRDIKVSFEQRLLLKPDREKFLKEKEELIKLLNKNIYNPIDDEQLFDIFMFTIATTITSVIHYFNNNALNSTKDIHCNRLQIIKYGIYRKEEKNDINN